MILAIIVFTLVLSFLVFSHELGHFLVAKKLGMAVEEFGLGFPPRIYGKKIGGTLYSINAIPFGGFVKVSEEDAQVDKNSFYAKPPWARAAVLLAGVTMNLLIAIVIFYIVLGFNGFTSYQGLISNHYSFPFGKQENYPAIIFVAKDSPAQKAGLKPFDVILSANNLQFHGLQKFVGFVDANKGKVITLKVENIETKKVQAIKVIPRKNPPKNEGPLGIGLSGIASLKYPTFLEKASSGILHSFNLFHLSIYGLAYLTKLSITKKQVGPIAESVAGPVKMLMYTIIIIHRGIWQILSFIGLISLGLAFVNILPIPAADGGRLVFVLYEMIFRKKSSVELERKVNLVGFYLLIILFVAITCKEIREVILLKAKLF